MVNKISVDVADNGAFKINMNEDYLPHKKDVLVFNDGEYVVSKVYRFKKIRMFLVRLGFKVSFYEIKPLGNGK